MISFRPTEEEAAFVAVARQFAEQEVRPIARDCEQVRGVPAALVNKARDLGLLALELPEQTGGLELPLISQVQILETLASGDLGVIQGLPGPGDAAPILRCAPRHPLTIAYGEAEDEAVVTLAFIDAADPRLEFETGVRAEVEGAAVRLYGMSRPTRLALRAKQLVVAVRTTDGETVLAWLNGDNARWHAEPGDVRLGLLAAGIGRVRFDGQKVPGDLIMARGPEADELLTRARARMRVLEAAKEVGLAAAALDYAVSYTAQRKAFGREIARFQAVSFTAADMAIETAAARDLVWLAATLLDKGDPSGRTAALRALAAAHRAVRFVTDNAVQLLGGSGYVQEYPVEKWMRDAQAQVGLYGREGELMHDLGAAILGADEQEGGAT